MRHRDEKVDRTVVWHCGFSLRRFIVMMIYYYCYCLLLCCYCVVVGICAVLRIEHCVVCVVCVYCVV
jgi:hypothetical protein